MDVMCYQLGILVIIVAFYMYLFIQPSLYLLVCTIRNSFYFDPFLFCFVVLVSLNG